MSVLREYPLRDLRGDDPDEHHGDDEAEARPVLEIGTHAHAPRSAATSVPSRPSASSTKLRREGRRAI